MKQETINQFYDYLKDQGHENTTIAGYIRTICDLEEPPDTTDPLILLVYVDQAIKLKRQSLSRANFASAQASLGSFFFMRAGVRIRDFRKQLQIAIFRGQQGRISRPDRAILNGQF